MLVRTTRRVRWSVAWRVGVVGALVGLTLLPIGSPLGISGTLASGLLQTGAPPGPTGGGAPALALGAGAINLPVTTSGPVGNVTSPPAGTGGLFVVPPSNVPNAAGLINTPLASGAAIGLSIPPQGAGATVVRVQEVASTGTSTTIAIETFNAAGTSRISDPVTVAVRPPSGVDPNTFSVTIVDPATGATQTFSVANGNATVTPDGSLQFNMTTPA
jgi:hypothetical protein